MKKYYYKYSCLKKYRVLWIIYFEIVQFLPKTFN